MTQDFTFDIVGFDLDGTLLDTSQELAASTNHALAALGRGPLSIQDVRPMIGLGGKHMLNEGLKRSGGTNPELLNEYYPVLLDHYDQHLGSGSPPFPGLEAVLEELESMGVKLAICTNKQERYAVKLIDAIGWSGRFSAIIGGDTMGKGNAKPSGAPIHEMIARSGGGRTAFIGDSIYDIMAAHAAGIPAIAVSFGFLHQPVEELGADAIIDHYDALIPTLGRLGK